MTLKRSSIPELLEPVLENLEEEDSKPERDPSSFTETKTLSSSQPSETSQELKSVTLAD